MDVLYIAQLKVKFLSGSQKHRPLQPFISFNFVSAFYQVRSGNFHCYTGKFKSQKLLVTINVTVKQ